MVVLVVVLAAVAVLLGVAGVVVAGRRGFDDVEGFHRARDITSGWARDGVTRPLIADDVDAEADSSRR